MLDRRSRDGTLRDVTSPQSTIAVVSERRQLFPTATMHATSGASSSCPDRSVHSLLPDATALLLVRDAFAGVHAHAPCVLSLIGSGGLPTPAAFFNSSGRGPRPPAASHGFPCKLAARFPRRPPRCVVVVGCHRAIFAPARRPGGATPRCAASEGLRSQGGTVAGRPERAQE